MSSARLMLCLRGYDSLVSYAYMLSRDGTKTAFRSQYATRNMSNVSINTRKKPFPFGSCQREKDNLPDITW